MRRIKSIKNYELKIRNHNVSQKEFPIKRYKTILSSGAQVKQSKEFVIRDCFVAPLPRNDTIGNSSR